MTLAVLILTHNEAHHIGRALASVSGIATETFIVDSGSTDGTVEIARAAGATVLTNPWVNYANQFQWGLDNAPITAEWVMRLDADEVIEPDLARVIAQRLGQLPAEVTGVNLKRKHVFMGRWIRHGGRYPLILLRIWRRGLGRIENRWMDEHIILERGATVVFEGGFSDVNLGDLTFFTDKHNKYATREAVDVLNQRLGLFPRDEALGDASEQATKKRGVKEGFYNRLPFGLGPIGYFLYRYFWQLGFLDGKEGAIYHGLQGLWYRFLVDAKLLELERALAEVEGRKAKLALLARLTGLKLPAADAD
ncbi:glycosyltransferase family 2 protein [Caulobacter segnis]|uniref:glycosyltransferase family 2 protein n=1 Tax=Caulobacter segnis TaxID=88688 RepID=UPI00285D5D47|nr:glycosyltransferase family 2 protein [Caulobacter segnis]MDR6624955.1 glycosyltransferase involved in cell wall biosynthesis [Caulobacter segnis]